MIAFPRPTLTESELLEYSICKLLVRNIVQRGYSISVFDGEDWPMLNCREERHVLSAMFSTDRDKLRVRTALGKFIGDILLLYGNAEDVICDWSDNFVTNELVHSVTAFE